MDFSKHTAGTTSVKVHHAPGGQSNFSIGWDVPEKAPQKNNTQAVQQPQPPVQKQQVVQPQNNQAEKPAAGKTSVKVHNPPGGKSNFSLGWNDRYLYANSFLQY